MTLKYKKLEKLSGRYNDLTGQKINKLEILFPIERPEYHYDMSIYWLCRCECGNEVIYPASRLRGKHPPKSCGCQLYERLDGKKFNLLYVLEEGGRDKNGKRMWKCQCECGNIVEIEASSLIKGYTKSCGCLKHKKQDLVGQKFGMLTVLSRVTNENKRGDIYWNCVCDCGKKIIIGGKRLRAKTKNIRSCGCSRLKAILDRIDDLTGKRFGRWTVISLQRVRKDGSRGGKWLCQCDCGTERIVAAKLLKSGASLSCGCYKREKTRIACLLPEGEASFRKLITTYKRGATDRALCFELEYDQIKVLTKQNCFYCGEPPSSIIKSRCNSGNYVYNGIDRLDNKIGYVIGNVVPCCSRCNLMKMELSVDDFKNKIIKIYNYFIKGETDN